jgi:tetratricopeptide (TPR) repeat protein
LLGIEAGQGLEKLSGDPGLFVHRAKGKTLQRFLLYVKRGEYESALKLYKRMKIEPLGSGQLDTVKTLLERLNEYKTRLSLYEHSSLLDDIKLSYLEEDYQKTFSHIQASDYLRPMLYDLQGVLYRNIETREQINQEIELKKKMKSLKRKAEDFEKRGEYENALKIYEDLLILNLPAYDREYLISKIHSLISESVRRQIKREDNTKATKYLESARDLYQQGREKEAEEVYREIATECPNSDYVEEAISAMLEIATR